MFLAYRGAAWARVWDSRGITRFMYVTLLGLDPILQAFSQRSLGVHKILVRKNRVSSPPPEKGPKFGKNCTNQYKILKIDTFSGGGGGNAILWTKRFYGHLGVSDFRERRPAKRSRGEAPAADCQKRSEYQTPKSVSWFGLTEFRRESSARSSQPIICVPKRTHRVFVAELTEFAAELSEFSPLKQYSRNSIPPVSYDTKDWAWGLIQQNSQISRQFPCRKSGASATIQQKRA